MTSLLSAAPHSNSLEPIVGSNQPPFAPASIAAIVAVAVAVAIVRAIGVRQDVKSALVEPALARTVVVIVIVPVTNSLIAAGYDARVGRERRAKLRKQAAGLTGALEGEKTRCAG